MTNLCDPNDVNIVLVDRTDCQNNVDVSADNPLPVDQVQFVSTVNSSNTPLPGDTGGVDHIFTGTGELTNGYGIIYVNVYSDVASATDGLRIEQSSDGINWDHDDTFTIPANTGKNFSLNPFARYYRVVYTNGASAQTDFRLQTILKANGRPSSHRIQDPISTDDDAELVKSVLTGENPNGEFVNFQSTKHGNFRVSVEEYGDTPSIDAFARLRISEPYTLFDSKQLHDKQPLFWDEEIGGSATSVHSSANADVVMTVTASASDYVIRQTKQRFNYQPGKSQLAFLTFLCSCVDGVTKRVGMFDDDGTGNNLTPNNGIFFQNSGTASSDVSWNVAKNGSVAETVTQLNWNVDTLDGSGDDNNPSGVQLDLSATQIAIIDYEWLGVGRIRVGFVIDGIIRYTHYFNHANNPSFTSVYMSTPNLPLRYDIQSDGTAGGTSSHICSTVMSEGGLEKTGILRSVDTGTTHLDIDANEPTFVVGIRLKDAYKDITVVPEFVSLINENNDDFRWSVCLNPTYTGTVTWSDLTNSAVQVGVGATADNVSDYGIEIAVGYASVDTLSVNQQLQTALRIGSAIDGTKDELVLVVTPLSSGADIQGALNFRELL